MLLVGEIAELRDVRSGGKGHIAATRKDQNLDLFRVIIRASDAADFLNPVIHGKGKRIAAVWPVENDPAYIVLHLIEQFLRHEALLTSAVCARYCIAVAAPPD